ncbi:MAG TPA: hypothetical protein VFO10_02755 [Oligoflexus sp.]|uniref:hypothetical protein n=1 Tax=Oligoflexus sp. TaxID=1971216 RepID=UPI002D7ECBD4|nr:hypothetical protein [Oligoflexus sp.]HET9236142.1 hypothetical protein [Oligoflexus sp.]
MPRETLLFLIDDYWVNIKCRRSLNSLLGEKQYLNATLHLIEYAYERNISGAAKRYREIASDAVKRHLTGRQRWSEGSEEKLWKAFESRCKKPAGNRKAIKRNPLVDPLRPSSKTKVNLITFIWNLKEDNTVASWAFSLISAGKAREAYRKLKTIYGIRHKIAAFYLRDIFWLGHSLNPPLKMKNPVDAKYLQPIDVWILRATKALGVKNPSRQDCIEAMLAIEKEYNLPFGGANIAFWNLGATYIGNEKDFKVVVSQLFGKQNHSDTSRVENAIQYMKRVSKFEKHISDSFARKRLSI